MSDTKLSCIITGKVLICSKDYFSKKVKDAGDEETLRQTYICRDAKKLLKRGYSIEEIRNMLNVTEDMDPISPEILNSILESEKIVNERRILSNFESVTKFVKKGTDPEVKEFIKKL